MLKRPNLDVEIKIYSKTDCKYCKLAKMLFQNYELEFEEEMLNENDKIATMFYKMKLLILFHKFSLMIKELVDMRN